MSRLIQKASGDPVDYGIMAQILGENISANSYLVGRRGKILGYHFQEDFICEFINDIINHSECFPENYNQQLLLITETVANMQQKVDTCFFDSSRKCPMLGKRSTIVPVVGGGERLGSLILTSVGDDLDHDSLVLSEHGATVMGMEIMRIKTKRVEVDTRKKAAVQIALGILSFSEVDAVAHVLYELAGTSGILVVSRIADRVGITRSVIVNALRKLECAGVIEAKSLGMKGTYLRVINENLYDELKKHKWTNKRS